MAYRDFAGYELSVGLEATIATFAKLMSVLNNPRKKFSVRFQDKFYGSDIQFDDAYINSLSVQISNNALTSLSVGFFIVKRDLELNFNATSNPLPTYEYGINNFSDWGYSNSDPNVKLGP